MKIMLLRHGRPDIDIPDKIRSSEIAEFIHRYDKAGVAMDSNPSPETIEAVSKMQVVVCSHLPRSLESAQKLTEKSILLSDEIFREAELPSTNWTYPRLKTGTSTRPKCRYQLSCLSSCLGALRREWLFPSQEV